MTRKVSIGWFRQRSGRYALKGITISENDRAYDSASTFREEDARWLTRVLGAEADVELAGGKLGERTADGYPEWALRVGQESSTDSVPPLDCERAGATLLRHYFTRLIEAHDKGNGSGGFQELANEANAALLATDAGTHYTLVEALTVLDRRGQKAGRTTAKR